MAEIASLIETECCGIRELNGVMSCKTAREAIVDAAEDWFTDDKDGAFIFFSTTNNSKIGSQIGAYITKYRLGTWMRTRPTLNPNSDNMLTMFVWTVNKQNFVRYWKNTKRYKANHVDDDY